MLDMPPCIYEVAEYYEVPIELILAVQKEESGTLGQSVGKIGPNSDGTYDLGIMQINTWWLESAGEASLKNWGIDEYELLTNTCTNIAVGTWVLHQNLELYKDTRKALAAYNTGKPNNSAGLEYADKVLKHIRNTASQN